MTCIWIMPTVSRVFMRGPCKHTEGHIAFHRVIRNMGLGKTCGVIKSIVLDISGTMLNKGKHDSVIYHNKL